LLRADEFGARVVYITWTPKTSLYIPIVYLLTYHKNHLGEIRLSLAGCQWALVRDRTPRRPGRVVGDHKEQRRTSRARAITDRSIYARARAAGPVPRAKYSFFCVCVLSGSCARTSQHQRRGVHLTERVPMRVRHVARKCGGSRALFSRDTHVLLVHTRASPAVRAAPTGSCTNRGRVWFLFHSSPTRPPSALSLAAPWLWAPGRRRRRYREAVVRWEQRRFACGGRCVRGADGFLERRRKTDEAGALWRGPRPWRPWYGHLDASLVGAIIRDDRLNDFVSSRSLSFPISFLTLRKACPACGAFRS
jgi:hypothetical protein